MSLIRSSLSLLATTVLIVGCTTSPVPVWMATPIVESIGFFDVEPGTARLSVRMVKPGITTQAFADADSFTHVLFVLTNPGKLKEPKKKLVATTGNGTFPAVFAGLPSDVATGYVLTATLLRNIPVNATLSDPALSNAYNKVGEGMSSAFSLGAGDNLTVPLVINALGPISLGSSFLPNQLVNFGVSAAAASNPRATSLRYATYLGSMLFGAQFRVDMPSQAPATLAFYAPIPVGSYKLVVDLLEGENVLSRRSLSFSVTPP